MSSSFSSVIEAFKSNFNSFIEINNKHFGEVLKSRYLFVLFLAVRNYFKFLLYINYYYYLFFYK